ncbi:30S ribosomal protein S8 [compost metagenome]|jgi:Ribosomal protein S8
MHSDPIADLLTRIRNANVAFLPSIELPSSKVKAEIARVLAEEGFISSYETLTEGTHPRLKLSLKYAHGKQRVIKGIKRISKPGLRVYAGKNELPRVLGGLGIAVISTPKGIMTDKAARKANVGGEVLAYVW